MSSMWRTAIPCLVLCTLARAPASLAGQPAKSPAAVPAPAPLRDGVHDFDYTAGAWKEHTTRLKNPLTGSTTWFDMDGYSVVRPLLGGHAQLVEYEGEAPSGQFSLLSVRLYDPEAHQWKINFSNPQRGVLWPTPMVGQFRDGRGEFYSLDDIDGRVILVRFTFLRGSANAGRSEQAFSADGGKTWETNWINTYTRMTDAEAARLTAQRRAAKASAPAPAPAEDDGRHDFDFEFGSWKTHISRRQNPLTGSSAWTAYDGTSVVHKVWDGRASLVELTVDGPAGHIEGIGLRLYNPASHQWSLNWASNAVTTMGPPTIGAFKDGRGEFYDQEPFNGKAILVRNIWSDITPDSGKFEQAFSADGGKTWEPNWIATDTRTKPASADLW